MNLLHMKYAVEVAKTRSINKAAERLYIGQPALSRAIKELENSLGATLFERTTKGMTLTPEGKIFISYAENVLRQVNDIEKLFAAGGAKRRRFSISVPRASYISAAFTRFNTLLSDDTDIDLYYKETNSMRAISNILSDEYRLGIVRYAAPYDKYYKSMLDEKGIDYELIAEFRYSLLLSKQSPLLTLPEITKADLAEYTEIAHADPYVPSLPFDEIKQDEMPSGTGKHIFVFERCSQFELLSADKTAFMWASPVPQETLNRYGLVQIGGFDGGRVYRDLLIHKRDYSLTELDRLFISELVKTKRELIG